MSLYPKQKEYLRAFKSQIYRALLLAGGVSSGKSIVCHAIIDEMCQDYGGSRYAIVRKNLSTLKRTSIPTFEKVIEINGTPDIKINKSDFYALYPNGSKIYFMEADVTKDRELNKIKGLELTGALLEEVNEMDELVFTIIKTRVGRWKNTEYKINPFILMNCNPDINWVKREFYDPAQDSKLNPLYYFLQATPYDNPSNTSEYLELLQTLPEADRMRLVDCIWEYSVDPQQLIQYTWLRDIKITTTLEEFIAAARAAEKRPLDISLGVDVAREGDDRTIFAYFYSNKLCKIEVFRIPDTAKVGELIKMRMDEFGIHPSKIGIDVIGLGVGVYDYLTTVKKIKGIYPYKSSNAASTDKEGEQKKFQIYEYKNKRAEDFWNLREDIRTGEIEIIDNKALVTELTNIRYEITEKEIMIEPKAAFKKRLHYSSDIADAVKIANFMRKIPVGFGKIILGKKSVFS